MGYKGALEHEGIAKADISKSIENDLHNDLKTPGNMSSPTKDSIKSPHLAALPATTTLGTKKGGRYIQTKYGEVKMTEDGSKFECKVCQHTFTRIESVHQHMAIHDETLAMKCDLCDEKFAWKSTLRKHRRTVHEGITTELTCTEAGCDRVFKSFGHRKVFIFSLVVGSYFLVICESFFIHTIKM